MVPVGRPILTEADAEAISVSINGLQIVYVNAS